MRGDDELVRRERSEGVVDRPERVGVADTAVGVDADLGERRERRVEPGVGLGPSAIVVREQVPKPRAERRTNDEDLVDVPACAAPDRRAQLPFRERVVCDHKDATADVRIRADGVLLKLNVLERATIALDRPRDGRV